MLGELVKSMTMGAITKPSHHFLDTVKNRYRVDLRHIDFNMHINNAKYLEFLERARWNHSVQTGTFNSLFRKGYNFIVAGIDIGYIRELNLFQAFDIETTYVGWDDKYFYIEQRCVVDGKIHSYALVKAVYIKKGKPAAPAKVFQSLGLNEPDTKMPEHMELWKDLATAKRAYSEAA